MKFFLLAIAFLCSFQGFSRRICNYDIISSLPQGNRVYISEVSPFFYKDSLFFDQDEMFFLGEGSFTRTIRLPNALESYENYFFIVEKPNYKPTIISIFDLFELGFWQLCRTVMYSSIKPKDREIKITRENEPIVKRRSVETYLDVRVGDFLESLSHIRYDRGEKTLSTAYHTGYTEPLKEKLGFQENELKQLAEITLTEIFERKLVDPEFSVVPPLTMKGEISMEDNKVKNNYANFILKMKICAEDTTEVLSKEYKEAFLILNRQSEKNYWVLQSMRDFVQQIDEKEVFEKFATAYIETVKEWEPIFLKQESDSSTMQSAVTISHKKGHGSGVILSNSGMIVTNAHVVFNQSNLVVTDCNGKEHAAEVVRINQKYDLALIKTIDSSFHKAATTGSGKAVEIGTPVVCIGSPLDGELNGSVSHGIISGIYPYNDSFRYIISATVNPGNSGGGLFDMNGNLIGIINAKIVGYDYQNIGFAIPVSEINSQLKVHYQ